MKINKYTLYKFLSYIYLIGVDYFVGIISNLI